jgi:hypothetical protein
LRLWEDGVPIMAGRRKRPASLRAADCAFEMKPRNFIRESYQRYPDTVYESLNFVT